MKTGDWVIDRYEHVGRIERMGLRMDEHAVQVVWHASMSDWVVPHPFVKQKYLTVITKEVADILIAVKP